MFFKPHQLRPTLPGEGRVTYPDRIVPSPGLLLSSGRRWIRAVPPQGYSGAPLCAPHLLPAHIRHMNSAQRH